MRLSNLYAVAICLLVSSSLWAQGTPGGPGNNGGGNGGGCSLSVECPDYSWVRASITIKGTANPGTVFVEVMALGDEIYCGDPFEAGMPVAGEYVTVGEDCKWEVTFTQGININSPFVCNPMLLDARDYRVFASQGGASVTCCFGLRVDCVIGPGTGSCCDQCLFDNFCSAPCLAMGFYPGGPYCY